jgi:hypothetical protein
VPLALAIFGVALLKSFVFQVNFVAATPEKFGVSIGFASSLTKT